MELIGPGDTEELSHFLVEKPFAYTVGLDPFTVENELRDGPFAHMADDFLCRPGVGLDINFGIGNLVLFKEPFSFAAIAAPRSGIDQNMHPSIIPTAKTRAYSTLVTTRSPATSHFPRERVGTGF
jgi:hypothetical protein